MNSRLSVQRILFGVATVAVLGFTSAVGQTIINVPPSPDPFVARSDEIVNVLPGGFLSSGFDALAGSQVNILGGGVGRFFESRTGSTTTITNGFVEQDWTVESGATANIGGGLIDDISAFPARSSTFVAEQSGRSSASRPLKLRCEDSTFGSTESRSTG